MAHSGEAKRRRGSLGFLLFLAARGLLQSRLITALLVVAVTAGVAFQIPNTANLLGYDAEILEHGVRFGFGDVRVRPRRGSSFEQGDALAHKLRPWPGVASVVPILLLPGTISFRGGMQGTLVMGVDAQAAQPPFQIDRGEALRAGDKTSAIVGGALVTRLHIKVGDRVKLRVFFGPDIGLGEQSGRFAMKVRGVAEGSFVAPQGVFVDRSFLAKEKGEPHAASIIVVHLHDHLGARRVARAIEAAFPEVRATAWMEDGPFLGSALKGSAAVGTISRTMVVFAVLIPVWALLYVHVLHRRRDVGLLGALGVRRGEVFVVFLLEAFVVGAVGVVLGALGGFLLVEYFDAHPVFSTSRFVIRPVVTLRTYLEPMLLVLLAAVAAGVVPAWRAARIDPARILRGAE